MARKKIGKENRITRSIRIEPRKLKAICKKHKRFQTWLDAQVDKELKLRPTKRPKIPVKSKKVVMRKIFALLDKAYSL